MLRRGFAAGLLPVPVTGFLFARRAGMLAECATPKIVTAAAAHVVDVGAWLRDYFRILQRDLLQRGLP